MDEARDPAVVPAVALLLWLAYLDLLVVRELYMGGRWTLENASLKNSLKPISRVVESLLEYGPHRTLPPSFISLFFC